MAAKMGWQQTPRTIETVRETVKAQNETKNQKVTVDGATICTVGNLGKIQDGGWLRAFSRNASTLRCIQDPQS